MHRHDLELKVAPLQPLQLKVQSGADKGLS